MGVEKPLTEATTPFRSTFQGVPHVTAPTWLGRGYLGVALTLGFTA